MKKNILILILIIFFCKSYSQAPTKHYAKHIIYTDILIVGVYNNIQLNYEYNFFLRDKINLNARIGFGVWTNWEDKGFIAPLSINLLFFKSASHIELMAGSYLFYDDWEKEYEFSPLIGLGYRYQKYKGHFVLRLKFEFSTFGQFQFLPGISLGWAF